MMRSVFLKTLYDKRWFIFGWFIGFGFLSFLMVIFFPAMHQDGALDALMKSMPPALQGMVGDLANLREFSTYLASQLFDIRLAMLSGVMVIILGLGLTIAEEESGQLRTLTSLPFSRGRILLEKFSAMIVIFAIVLLGMLPGLWFGNVFVADTISVDVLVRLLFMNWLLCLALGSVVFGIGLATGKRAVAMTLGIVVVVGGFILSTFAKAVDWLEPYAVYSPLHYFPAVDVAKEGIAVGDVLVLASITVLSVLIGWISFRKRDIK